MDECGTTRASGLQRRWLIQMLAVAVGGALVLQGRAASARTLSDLTAADATAGVRTALERGASMAVELLGRPDGFLGHPRVRIPLPGVLEDNKDLLRSLGQGCRVDELSTAINRAAELAVPMGRAFS